MSIDLAAHELEFLLPERGATTVAELLASYDPAALAAERGLAERPFVFTNFAATLDGRSTIEGRSGAIGSDTDTAMLVGLRTTADAVMIGAGTLRAERYGRVVPDAAKRALREARGLGADPLAVLVSGRLDLPWDVDLFTDGGGRIVVFTSSDQEPPETATPLEVVRQPGGFDPAAALAHLRGELGIRSVLCEGGPSLHGTSLEAGLVDALFVTRGALVGGGEGPAIVEGFGAEPVPLELLWLLSAGSELFSRYGVVR